MRRLLVAAALLLLARPAFADTVLRTGAHDGFGRVVFEFATDTGFTTARDGDRLVLHFEGAGTIPSSPGGTRNVASVTGGQDSATLRLSPGTRLRTMRLGHRVVIDVLDPEPKRRAAPAAAAQAAAKPAVAASAPPSPAAAPPRPALPTPQATPAALPTVQTPATAPAPATPAAVSAPAPSAPAISVPAVSAPAIVPVPQPAPTAQPVEETRTAPASAEPVALSPRTTDAPGVQGKAILLPFNATTAAASFRHGNEAWLVFDERRPLDLASLADGTALSGATVQLLAAGTLVRLPMPPGSSPRLTRRPSGWALSIATTPQPGDPLAPQPGPDRVLLPAPNPGDVVTVSNPTTGENLLVGTLRASGPGVPVAYRVPEFSVLPSWQGVVVEPLSDQTVLRSGKDGFSIITGTPLSPPPAAARALVGAAVLTRRFDFPADPPDALLHRLQLQMDDESHAPAQSRLSPRAAAAQTMIALGLGPEAQSVLQLAASEDPRAANDPDTNGLAGIAALLADRPNEAGGLLDPALDGSDEVALWRAVRQAMLQPDSQQAAPVFASTIGLVLAYPAALRNRLLPLAAETMAEGGAPQAADALLAKLPDEPLLAFARAERMAAKGDTAAALTLYDSLAQGRDRLVSARAATKATLLRLATKALTPAEAAKALERGFLDWRGDGRELDLRLRVADLRAEAGQWASAFAMLRETAPLYPDAAETIRAHTAALMGKLLQPDNAKTVAPLDLVTIAEENAEALAAADPAVASALLADKLAALDLPRRAGPVLQRMIDAAPPSADRARLGARLAAMRLSDGDTDGAARALSSTDTPNLPADLTEQRGLVDARIHASAHDPGGAAAILAGIDTAAADDLRASILSDASDWHGAEAALLSLASRTVPPSGPLTDAQQDVLVRLASVEARAGDADALHALGTKEAIRISGPRGDMFRLLTAAPVDNVRDLRRAAGEVALARAVPAGLAAIGAH